MIIQKEVNSDFCHPCVGSPHPAQPREILRGVDLSFPLPCNVPLKTVGMGNQSLVHDGAEVRAGGLVAMG